jgi:hypothetical protein
LAEGLDVFRAGPFSILSRLGNHIGKKALFFLLGLRRDIGGTSSVCRSSGAPRSTTLAPLGNKLHEVFFVVGHVIGNSLSDIIAVGEVSKELV